MGRSRQVLVLGLVLVNLAGCAGLGGRRTAVPTMRGATTAPADPFLANGAAAPNGVLGRYFPLLNEHPVATSDRAMTGASPGRPAEVPVAPVGDVLAEPSKPRRMGLLSRWRGPKSPRADLPAGEPEPVDAPAAAGPGFPEPASPLARARSLPDRDPEAVPVRADRPRYGGSDRFVEEEPLLPVALNVRVAPAEVEPLPPVARHPSAKRPATLGKPHGVLAANPPRTREITQVALIPEASPEPGPAGGVEPAMREETEMALTVPPDPSRVALPADEALEIPEPRVAPAVSREAEPPPLPAVAEPPASPDPPAPETVIPDALEPPPPLAADSEPASESGVSSGNGLVEPPVAEAEPPVASEPLKPAVAQRTPVPRVPVVPDDPALSPPRVPGMGESRATGLRTSEAVLARTGFTRSIPGERLEDLPRPEFPRSYGLPAPRSGAGQGVASSEGPAPAGPGRMGRLRKWLGFGGESRVESAGMAPGVCPHCHKVHGAPEAIADRGS